MLSSHELARMHASIREIEKGAKQNMLAILIWLSMTCFVCDCQRVILKPLIEVRQTLVETLQASGRRVQAIARDVQWIAREKKREREIEI